MMYLLPTGSDNMKGMDKNKFGVIRTPAGGNAWGIKNGYCWAADNGAFTGVCDPRKFLDWLNADMTEYRDTCLFVVVPDVMLDVKATLEQYARLRPLFEGWPVAFVAQDGQENYDLPEFDWLFIGGSTEWKLGQGALECIKRAKELGKKVHVGRVNSEKRVKHFMLAGVDSVDGTCWKYGPRIHKKRHERWMSNVPLFDERIMK